MVKCLHETCAWQVWEGRVYQDGRGLSAMMQVHCAVYLREFLNDFVYRRRAIAQLEVVHKPVLHSVFSTAAFHRHAQRREVAQFEQPLADLVRAVRSEKSSLHRVADVTWLLRRHNVDMAPFVTLLLDGCAPQEGKARSCGAGQVPVWPHLLQLRRGPVYLSTAVCFKGRLRGP